MVKMSPIIAVLIAAIVIRFFNEAKWTILGRTTRYINPDKIAPRVKHPARIKILSDRAANKKFVNRVARV